MITMEAGTLNCPMCGAATRSDSANCGHCGTRLATVACPGCFGMIFEGSKFCPHCGCRADRVIHDPAQLICPQCETGMIAVEVGGKRLVECASCHGVWVDPVSFEEICKEKEEQRALPGSARTIKSAPKSLKVKYLPCPVCRQLMHRVNFAKCSGVVLDVCQSHGTWFDQDELKRIVEFISSGGMERAKRQEIEELEQKKRKLQKEYNAGLPAIPPPRDNDYDIDIVDVVAAAGKLIHRIFRSKLR